MHRFGSENKSFCAHSRDMYIAKQSARRNAALFSSEMGVPVYQRIGLAHDGREDQPVFVEEWVSQRFGRRIGRRLRVFLLLEKNLCCQRR
jgi:hypothetical protein